MISFIAQPLEPVGFGKVAGWHPNPICRPKIEPRFLGRPPIAKPPCDCVNTAPINNNNNNNNKSDMQIMALTRLVHRMNTFGI